MRKSHVCLMAAFLLLTVFSTELKAENKTEVTSAATTLPVESTEVKVLLSRLDEINAMDKSGMKPSEKKELRKEVRSIKSELNELGGGVYISVGAIIIILLLLIILL